MKELRAVVLSFGVAGLLSATSAPRLGAQIIEPFSVVTTPGGPLAAGRYNCKGEYNRGGYTYKVVELVSATRYAWRGAKRRIGDMTYDARSGEIRFITGPFGKVFTGRFGRRGDGKPVFILVNTQVAPKSDAYDYCVLAPGS